MIGQVDCFEKMSASPQNERTIKIAYLTGMPSNQNNLAELSRLRYFKQRNSFCPKSERITYAFTNNRGNKKDRLCDGIR